MKKNESKVAGGIARREKLSAEKRSEIARNAAIARHKAKKPLEAMKKGNFKDDFGVDVECYVLNDENNTAVISQTGMGIMLGLSPRANAFPRFMSSKSMENYYSAQLRKKIENPYKFQWVSGSAQTVSVNGYDAATAIDVCRAILDAENAGSLNHQQRNVAKQANIIIGASAKSGIQELVYKIAGFDSTKAHFVQAFKAFIQEEAKKYEKEFPLELYEEWGRLYELEIPDRGWPWEFMHLTVKHIYTPLAKSDGQLLALLRGAKEKGGDKKAKLFQFLNTVGTRALRMQLGRVLEMAESSPDKTVYLNKIAERFGGQIELEINSSET